MEQKEKTTDVLMKVSTSMKEEQFMYLSIIVALLAYNSQVYWLMWLFGIKGTFEGITSIIMAFAEYKKFKNQ